MVLINSSSVAKMCLIVKLFLLVSLTFLTAAKVPFFLDCETGTCTQRIDRNICGHFYDLSCSQWLKSAVKPHFEPVWNRHLELNYENYERLIAILENESDFKSDALRKTQHFYRECIKTAENDGKHWKNLKLLLELLKGWPITKTHWPHRNSYDFLDELVQIQRLLNVHPILRFTVNLDYKNTSVYALYIEPGDLIFPHHILNNSHLYQSELKLYEEWILKTLEHLYGKNNRNVMENVRNIVDFEQKLANIHTESKLFRSTASKLHRQFQADWLTVLKKLFGNMSDIDGNQIVIVRNIQYFRKLFLLVQSTDKRIIANYFMWAVLKELSRDTTNYMRHLSFLVDKAVLGVDADLPRTVECALQVNKYLSWAVVPKYVDLYLPDSTLKEVHEITDNIQREFVHLLSKTTWLSPTTTRLIVDKIKNVRKFIGYPKWVTNRNLLDAYYKPLNFTNNHFLNVLKVRSFQVERELMNVDKVAKETIWISQIFDANAYYNILQNAIFIPLGILHPPFFHPNQSASLNYGALGSLIGHEFSHALDTTGRQANKNGVIGKWWPQQDIQRYQDRVDCFEGHNNGVIGESIADAIGIKISFVAFVRNHLKSEERKSFFVRFAQMWCEKGQDFDFFHDEHGPSQHRVTDTLKDSGDFLQTFNCNNNNTDNLCNLW